MSFSTAVLYMTHFINDELVSEVERLGRETRGHLDAFVLYDVAGGAWSGRDLGVRVVTQDSTEIASRLGTHMADHPGPGLQPGCQDLAVADFFDRFEEYEAAWIIEYDVRFTGPWMSLFGAFSGNDADLLTTTLTTRKERPDWPWWSTLKAPAGVARRSYTPIRGFHPVFRITRRGLDFVRAAYKAGWLGHCEATLPTILNRKGYRIEDIGGNGSFVARGNLERFYTNSPLRKGEAPGTFVWRPVRESVGQRLDTLWHPVKAEEDI